MALLLLFVPVFFRSMSFASFPVANIFPFSNLEINASLITHAIPFELGMFCKFGLVLDNLQVLAIV